MTQQQLLNYLYWLKDRGQTFASPAGPEGLLGSEKVDASNAESCREKFATPQSMSLLFVSKAPLCPSEADMVTRIAAALGVSEAHYQMVQSSELPGFHARIVVVLGEIDAEIKDSLTISHPAEMLKEPRLKASAWEKLKALKPQLANLIKS